MTCGGAPYTGGRRRKGVKKTRKHRGKKQRGGGYGFNQGPPIAVGAAAVTGASDSAFLRPDGTPAVSGGDAPKVGGRRKSRKASKKSRKSRRKSMRGGAASISAGQRFYSFTGAGERGIISPVGGSQPGNEF